jgi:hypothetical protein
MDQFDDAVTDTPTGTADSTPASRPALPDPNTDDAWKSDEDRQPVEAKAETDAPAPPAKLEGRERNPDGTLKPKSAKPRDNPFERVKQATGEAAAARAEAEAAKREAAEWRAKAEAREAERAKAEPVKAEPAAEPSDDMPSIDDVGSTYKDWNAYQRALAEWQTAQIEQKWQAREAKAAEARELESWQRKAADAHEAVPNWTALSEAADNAVIAAGFRLPDGRAQWPTNLFKAVMGSDRMADLVQFLGSHPEECTQWAQDCASTPPPAATVVRRLLERQLSSAAAGPDSARSARPSTAKPPVNRVGSSASATPLDPDDMDFGPEYIQAENARERKRREARRAW